MSASVRSLLPELGSDPVAAVRAGLPTAALNRLQSHLQVSDARLAPLLGVFPRTLRRRRTAGTLTPDASDRLVGLAEVIVLAQRALDGAEPAREWLRTPHSLLGGASPFDRMDTRVGMKEVTTMLAHVEHGMPA
jgi:putative toxin-antitoxin system antitoxin component (TIGR02293 family)